MRSANIKLRVATLALVTSGLLLALPVAASANTATFTYTGAEQTFTVPAGVTSVHVAAVGGKGGTAYGSAGFGATVAADLAVTPGETLFVEVGGNGGGSSTTSGGAAAFNGGGAGGVSGQSDLGGGGGGGASDVRTLSAASGTSSVASRLVIAGGGGGGGGGTNPANKFSGGSAGQAGSGGSSCDPGGPDSTSQGCGGGAGTAGSGGAGGAGVHGDNGTSGDTPVQGAGGSGGSDGSAGSGGTTDGGGGGGGGLHGGGGGGAGTAQALQGGAGGGGGGSSGFGSGATNNSVSADATGIPSITFTYTPPSGGGGGGSGGTSGGSGGGGGTTVTSNFNLTQPAVSKTGVLTFNLNAPGPGTFTASATTILPTAHKAHLAKHRRKNKPKKITYGSATVAAFNAGAITLVIRPSGAAKAALAKGQRLTVLVTIKFTPASGGTPTTHQTTVLVKGSKPKAKRHR